MTDTITIAGLSLAAGAVLAAQDIPVSGIEVLDRAGLAGIAVALVWWMMTSFSKRLDKLTAAVERLAEKIE